MDKLNSTINKTYHYARDLLFSCHYKYGYDVNDLDSVKCNINVYVTQLNGNHLPERRQNKEIHDLLYKLQKTDSISERAELKNKIAKLMSDMLQELVSMRGRIFVLKNKDTLNAYAMLADGFNCNDRDNYIQCLSNYHDIILELGRGHKMKINHYDNDTRCFSKELDLAIDALGGVENKATLYLHHNTFLYGDLDAISCLRQGIPAKVPDFTYNTREDHFG